MPEVLAFDHVTAGYGNAVVLDRLDFSLQQGESLAILGRNGVGKTTLLETLMGNTRVMQGAIRWQGADITRWPSHQRVRAGLGWVPQEREVFPSLTVEENLTVIARPGGWNLQRVYEFFPRLRERRGNYGNQLSGGEQQMLAIGRALMTTPKLLLLDEPMEGLAPIIVEELSAAIRRLCESEGLASIVVEQHPVLALEMTHQAIVLERGTVVHAGPSAGLAADKGLLEGLLGVGIADAETSCAASADASDQHCSHLVLPPLRRCSISLPAGLGSHQPFTPSDLLVISAVESAGIFFNSGRSSEKLSPMEASSMNLLASNRPRYCTCPATTSNSIGCSKGSDRLFARP
jgi:branched-chain amino acid transport system ATP-binding protein